MWKSRRHGNIPYDRNRVANLSSQDEHKPKELFTCPICGYDGLRWKPYYEGWTAPSFETCSCCGFEYGYHDMDQGWSFEDYRRKWIQSGALWRSPEHMPDGWSLKAQLKNIGVEYQE